MKPDFRHKFSIAVFGCAGLALWIVVGSGRGIGWPRWTLLVCLTALGTVPPIARAIDRRLAPLRNPSGRNLRRTTLGVALASALYFVVTAILQNRDLFPKTHDDCSYAIGIQILSRFRLWMPSPALPDFFDSFYLLVRPVYCSIYFPGTALLYVPTAWLHLPSYVMPALASGFAVAMLYRVVSEMIDGAFGLLAALMMASISWFRVFGILLTAHVPMLLFGLLMVWATLRWRKTRSLRWAATLGACSGWAAITRPADALIFGVPIAIAVFQTLAGRVRPQAVVGENKKASDAPSPGTPGQGRESILDLPIGEGLPRVALRTQRRRPSPQLSPGMPGERAEARPSPGAPREGATPPSWLSPLLMIAAALPFLALQIIFNVGVTGDPFKTPYTYYLEHDQPRTQIGFHAASPSDEPLSASPQKRDLYQQWIRPRLTLHTPANLANLWAETWLPLLIDATMQCRLLLIFLPIGVLTAWRRDRWILWLSLPLFLLVYSFNPFFLEHYGIIMIPAVALLILLSAQAIASAWPHYAVSIHGGFIMMILAITLTSFPEINRWIKTPGTGVSDETFDSAYLVDAFANLPQYGVKPPAVVLFKYHSFPGLFKGVPEFIQEPVYNADVADPDEAPIIHAHDLGPRRNREIFEYYSSPGRPGRIFWSYDAARGADALQRMGTGAELLARHNQPSPDAR